MRSLFGARESSKSQGSKKYHPFLSEFVPSRPEFMSRVEGEWFPNLPWHLKEPMDQIAMVQAKLNHPSNVFLVRLSSKDCGLVPPHLGKQIIDLSRPHFKCGWEWGLEFGSVNDYDLIYPDHAIEKNRTTSYSEKNVFKSISHPRTLGTIFLK